MPQAGSTARGDAVEIACYGPTARALHWLIALLAAIVIGLGLAIPGEPRETAGRALVLLLHRSVGLTILALMIVRVGWRLVHPAPPLPASLPRLEAWLARADHAALYLLFLAMPVAGYLNAAAAAHPVSWFNLFTTPAIVPPSPRLSQIAIAAHLLAQFLIYVFVGLHVAAALLHRFVRRNAVWQRMLPPRRRRPAP